MKFLHCYICRKCSSTVHPINLHKNTLLFHFLDHQAADRFNWFVKWANYIKLTQITLSAFSRQSLQPKPSVANLPQLLVQSVRNDRLLERHPSEDLFDHLWNEVCITGLVVQSARNFTLDGVLLGRWVVLTFKPHIEPQQWSARSQVVFLIPTHELLVTETAGLKTDRSSPKAPVGEYSRLGSHYERVELNGNGLILWVPQL